MGILALNVEGMSVVKLCAVGVTARGVIRVFVPKPKHRRILLAVSMIGVWNLLNTATQDQQLTALPP